LKRTGPHRRTLDLCRWACAAGILVVALSSFGQKRRVSSDDARASSKEAGRAIFASSCAGCHGLDGRGSDRAPDIATRKDVQRRTDVELFHIIDAGVPGTGMPPFHSLGKANIDVAVTYLRVLQGKDSNLAASGDAMKGKALFFGKAGCSKCHVVHGDGGFIASDLSEYASIRSVSQIRQAIENPNAIKNRSNQIVVVTTRDGQKLSGIARNEDNFSLQLQTMDGSFYSFVKSDVQGVERSSQTLMPSNYGSTLTSAELDDIVAYIVTASRSGNASAESKVQPNSRKAAIKKGN